MSASVRGPQDLQGEFSDRAVSDSETPVNQARRNKQAAKAAPLFLPHHHVFGFLAAVASIEAFIEIDVVVRWPRENETHFIAAASGAGSHDDGWSCRAGLVSMRHD
jgi:hypothetical protein